MQRENQQKTEAAFCLNHDHIRLWKIGRLRATCRRTHRSRVELFRFVGPRMGVAHAASMRHAKRHGTHDTPWVAASHEEWGRWSEIRSPSYRLTQSKWPPRLGLMIWPGFVSPSMARAIGIDGPLARKREEGSFTVSSSFGRCLGHCRDGFAR